MRTVKKGIAYVAVGLTFVVVVIYRALDEASGDSEKMRTVNLTGRWPYRWLW